MNSDAQQRSAPNLDDDVGNNNNESSHLLPKPENAASWHEQIPVVYIVIILVVLLGLEEFIRVLESAICKPAVIFNRKLWTIDEQMCKLDSIQRRLAFIQGWQGLFDAFAGLAVPFTLAYRDSL